MAKMYSDPDISPAMTSQSFFGGYEKDKEPKLSEDNLTNIKTLMAKIGEGGTGAWAMVIHVAEK
jgi:hypothetical protein